MEMAARLSAVKIATTFVHFQFEYVVEPLLQDIAHDLLDGQVLDRAHNDPKSEAKPPLGPADTAKSQMEADTSAQDERIAVRVDWSRITDEIQAVAVGSWCRADVTSASPFGDDDLTNTWEEDVSTQTSTAALRPAQATQVVEAVLGALKRTVGRVSWQRLLRAVLGYGLTASSEWDIVLRYSLILRLKVMEHYDGRDPARHRTELKRRHVAAVSGGDSSAMPHDDDSNAHAALHNEVETLDWPEDHRVAVDAVIRDAADDFYAYEEDATQVRRGLAASELLSASGWASARASPTAGDFPPTAGSSTLPAGSSAALGRRGSLDRLSTLVEPAQGLLSALSRQTHADSSSPEDMLEPISNVLAQLVEEARAVDVFAGQPGDTGDACDGATNVFVGARTAPVGCEEACSPLMKQYHVGGFVYAAQGNGIRTSGPASPLVPHAHTPNALTGAGAAHAEQAVHPGAETPPVANSNSTNNADSQSRRRHSCPVDLSSTSRRGPARDGAMSRDAAEYLHRTERAAAAREALFDHHPQAVVRITVRLVMASVQRLLQELRHRPHQGFVSAIRFGSASFPARHTTPRGRGQAHPIVGVKTALVRPLVSRRTHAVVELGKHRHHMSLSFFVLASFAHSFLDLSHTHTHLLAYPARRLLFFFPSRTAATADGLE